MRYGPTTENMRIIRAKAIDKLDGAYRFRGVAYRVRNRRVTHIASSGKLIELVGNFDVEIGTYNGNLDSALKIMIMIL